MEAMMARGSARPGAGEPTTVVLDVSGMLRASQQQTVQARLSRAPGVLAVEANATAQTATVRYDPAATSVARLQSFVAECGMHCAGQSVPAHICDPAAEPAPTHASHQGPGTNADDHAGHGGGHHADHHGSHDMAAMVAAMRNRFVVAAVFSVPILLWSPIGRDVLSFSASTPFGLRDDVWQL